MSLKTVTYAALAMLFFGHLAHATPQVILVGENHAQSFPVSLVWDPSAKGRQFIFSEALQGSFPFISELVPGRGLGDISMDADLNTYAKALKIPQDKLDFSRIRALESDAYALYTIIMPFGLSENNLETKIRDWIPSSHKLALSAILEMSRRFGFGAEVYVDLLKEINKEYPSGIFRTKLDQLTRILYHQWNRPYDLRNQELDAAMIDSIGFTNQDVRFLVHRLRKVALNLANDKYPDLQLPANFENVQAGQEIYQKIIKTLRNDVFAKKIYSSYCYEFRNEPYIIAYMGNGHLEGVRENLQKLGISDIKVFDLYEEAFPNLLKHLKDHQIVH